MSKPKKKRPGRPPTEGVARAVWMQVRALVEERARWHRAARLAGYASTSDWIRSVLNAAADAVIEKR